MVASQNLITTGCKSLKLWRTNSAVIGYTSAVLGSLFGLVAVTAYAQTPAQKPLGRPAFIRFWNMLPDGEHDNLQVYLADGKLLTATSGGDASVSYIPVLPGTFMFSVRRVGEVNKDVKTSPVQLLADSFVTLLATSKNGQISLDVLNETIDPKKDDGTGRLIVRQFSVGAHVLVSIGQLPPKALNYGEIAVFSGLPAGQVPLVVQATLPNGKLRTMNTQADFTKKSLCHDASGKRCLRSVSSVFRCRWSFRPKSILAK